MPKLKKKSNPMGDYIPSDEEVEAYVWGIRNNLRIAPRACSAVNNNEWYVELNLNGKWTHSGEKFGPVEVWQMVYKYYNYYYEKNKSNE